MQTKLLKVLDDGLITRVGEPTPSAKVEFRVIAATNQDLRAMTADKRFRDDLYYRVAGATIQVPTLRERGDEDIGLLAREFLANVARTEGRPIELGDDALEVLVAHSWPGNVRELRNAMRHAAYRQRTGVVTRDDLRLDDRRQRQPDRLADLLHKDLPLDECHAILDAMYMKRMVEPMRPTTSRTSPGRSARAAIRSGACSRTRGSTSRRRVGPKLPRCFARSPQGGSKLLRSFSRAPPRGSKLLGGLSRAPSRASN